MSLIEKFLRERSEQHPDLEILHTHWQEIKHRQAERLQLIREYFPHYTGHDAGHSERILDAICAMLGNDKSAALPTVDLWLLCTAAWYHDLGMSLTLKDKKELLRDIKFFNFIEDIKQDNDHPLHKCSVCFDTSQGKLVCLEHTVTLQNLNALRYLIAGYLRGDHAARSHQKIVTDELLGLISHDLPRRLIILLACICAAHGAPRENLLELPLEEYSCLCGENCHPRLIAALLRFGDLLDLDSTRVPEELIASLGYLPPDTVAHLAAARSITHFTLTPDLIEITGICPKPNSLLVLESWFKLISNEYNFQNSRWNQICPHKSMASLPALGSLNAHLEKHDPIGGKLVSRFLYDEQSIFALLRGANIYDDRTQALRELIQNAVDAIYLRVFLEWEGRYDEGGGKINSSESLTFENFRQRCLIHHITVTIEEGRLQDQFDDEQEDLDLDDDDATQQERKYWRVSVCDDGIGMNENDLQALFTVGHPKQQREKHQIIAHMPQWMRPSGIFGVGFQSVFLLTNEVRLSTLKLGENKRYELSMHTPEKHNFIANQTCRGNYHFGTSISFETSAALENVYPFRHRGMFSGYEISSYDSSSPNPLNQFGAQLADVARRCVIESWVKCSITYNGITWHNDPEHSQFEYFDEKTCLQLHLRSEAIVAGACDLYFRNQELKQNILHLRFLGFTVNILGYPADQILTLSRNSLKSSGLYLVERDLKEAAFRYIDLYFDRLSVNDCIFASMFCHYYSHKLDTTELPDLTTEKWQKILDYWRYSSLSYLSSSIFTRLENFDLIEVKIHRTKSAQESGKYHFTFFERNGEGEGYHSIDLTQDHYPSDNYEFFALSLLPLRFTVISLLGPNHYVLRVPKHAVPRNVAPETTNSRTTTGPRVRFLTSKGKRFLATEYLNTLQHFKRGICICPDNFALLRLKAGDYTIESKDFSEYEYPAMFCPFVANYDHGLPPDLRFEVTDELIANTQRLSAHTPPPSQEEIRTAYERFRAEFEPSFQAVASGRF